MNINLFYETYKNQNQGLVTPKLVHVSLVLPKYNIELIKKFIIIASYNMDHVKYSCDNIILNYYQFTITLLEIMLFATSHYATGMQLVVVSNYFGHVCNYKFGIV